MSETCAPPEEHAHHEWHWLRHNNGRVWPARWFVPHLIVLGKPKGYYVATWPYEAGWRYVAPCVPPPASEGEG